MAYKCVKVCYHNKRTWKVGEVYTPRAGEIVPKHFQEVKPEAKAAPVVDNDDELKTLSEYNKKIHAEEKKAADKLEGKTKKIGSFLE